MTGRKVSYLSFALVIVMTLSLLVGCTPGKNNQTTAPTTAATSATSQNQQAETDKKDVKGKISLWCAWGEGSGPASWIEDFNKEYPNVEVAYNQFRNNEEGNTLLDVSLLAGEADVVLSYGVEKFIPRAQKGMLHSMNDFLAKDGVDVSRDFSPETYVYNDQYYGLPITCISEFITINKDMFDAEGIGVPEEWTYDEYLDIARKLTKGEGANKVYGCADHKDQYFWTYPAVSVLGSNALYNEEKLSNFDNPYFKQAIEMRYNMEVVEKIAFPYLEIWASNLRGIDFLLQERVAMIVDTSSSARYFNNMTEYPRDFTVTFAPYPKTLADQEHNYANGLKLFGYVSINTNTADKDAAWAFIKWLGLDNSSRIAQVGHIPSYTGTDKDAVIVQMFGDLEATGKLIDIEAFKRVVLDYKSVHFSDNHFDAYDQLFVIGKEEFEKVMSDMISVDEAISNMKRRADEAIKRED
jgi:multiple sugar transport system substrate-binding protein